ncbi:protein unc-93 homolog A-like [Clytia hemisphaerica]|uniref:protein unc-93 homolog A-like n=1 Tax=Clytia hemisphaerica TaxID=252671 RepID=UPI0034D61348
MKKLLFKKTKVNENEETKDQQSHSSFFIYKNLAIITFAVFINFTGFSGLQNLQSSLHPEIGFICLCILYAAFMVSCLFLPNLTVWKLGYKYTMVLGMNGYATFSMAQFYPKLWLMAISACIAGCASAIFWSSISSMLTLLATRHANDTKTDFDSINQKFFAIFYFGFRMAHVIGNLISSVVLTKDSTTDSVSVNFTQPNLQCGIQNCPGQLTQNINVTLPKTDLTSSNVQQLFYIYLGTGIFGVIAVLLTLSNLKDQSPVAHKTLKRELGAVLVFLRNTTIWKLSVLPIGIGISLGFVYSDLTKAFVTCAFGVNNVGYSMMCFGASSCVSSFIIQSIVRKTGSFVIILIGWFVYMATIVWLFFWEISEQPLYVVFITISLLGFSDVAVFSQIHGFFGVMFPENKTEVFSVFKVFNSLGQASYFAYGNHLCIRTKLFIVIAFYLVGICLYAHVYRGFTKDIKKPKDIEMEPINS